MSMRHTNDFDHSTTAAPTQLVGAPTRLAAVLTVGQRELETSGFFSKADPLDPFRKAVTQWDDKEVEKKVRAAVAKLRPDQTKALADEFAREEAKAWEEVVKASQQEDYHKQRLEKVKALEALLRAQLGLATLHKYDPSKSVTALPTRPEMPPIYKYHLWPSYPIKKSANAWPDYRMIRDHWKAAKGLVVTVGHRK